METSKIIYLGSSADTENIDDSKDVKFNAPAEVIRQMYDYADERGSVIVCDCELDFQYNEIEHRKQYTMNWSKNDADKTVEKYEKLYEDIKKIASLISYRQLIDNTVDIESLPAELREVWEKYICPLKADEDETKDGALNVKTKRQSGESVSKNEQLLYDRYISMAENEAVSRIGKGVEAGMVIRSARNLCAVMCLGAPEEVAVSFGGRFAAALAVHRFCSSAASIGISVKSYS